LGVPNSPTRNYRKPPVPDGTLLDFRLPHGTRSSAVAKRPRDASCLSVVSFIILQRSFLLLFTAASDLLVHKILLNSVLLSPIISDQTPTDKHPLGHNPLFAAVRGSVGVRTCLVGRIRSGVRESASFQQKIPAGFCPTTSYGAENGGYDQGGLTSLRLRRITSSPSQTLRRRLVQTTDDGCRGEGSTLGAVQCH